MPIFSSLLLIFIVYESSRLTSGQKVQIKATRSAILDDIAHVNCTATVSEEESVESIAIENAQGEQYYSWSQDSAPELMSGDEHLLPKRYSALFEAAREYRQVQILMIITDLQCADRATYFCKLNYTDDDAMYQYKIATDSATLTVLHGDVLCSESGAQPGSSMASDSPLGQESVAPIEKSQETESTDKLPVTLGIPLILLVALVVIILCVIWKKKPKRVSPQTNNNASATADDDHTAKMMTTEENYPEVYSNRRRATPTNGTNI